MNQAKPLPPGFMVRQAIPEDQPACARVFTETYPIAFPHEPPGAGTEAAYYAAIEGEEQWVGCMEEKIIAVLSIDYKYNFIHSFYILPAWQRRGLGNAMLDHVMRRASGAVELKTDRLNGGALAFYRRLGWREVGEGRSPAGPWLRFRKQGGVL